MKYYIVFVLILSCVCSNAQNILVLEEKCISTNIDFPVNEPHFIIDPTDPNHYIVASIVIENWEKGKSAESHIVLLQSWDAGKTWKEKHFNGHNIISGYDPYLAMNKDGTLILTSLNVFKDQRFIHLLVFVSKDGGRSWADDPFNLGSSHDRQSVIVEPFRQKFVIVSSSFNRNVDKKGMRGLMFTTLARNGAFIEANWHEIFNVNKDNGMPVITANGNLIVPIIDYSLNNELLETRRNWIVKSKDLGRTLSPPTMVSENGSFPHLILDTTESKKPKLHHIQTKGKFREYSGFTATTSEDYGYTWSEKVDITQFQGNKPYIRNAQWVINNKGIIGVFWFDRRETDAKSHDLYFTYSDDQAKSFKSPVKVSTKSSTPNIEVNMNDKRWPVGGEYFGLTVSNNGDFKVIWPDYRSGRPQLYFASIRINE